MKIHWEQRGNPSVTWKNFGFLNSKHLKLEVNGAKPSKLKEEYSPSRIPYPVTVLIKWEGRIKTPSDMQDLKKFTLHGPFSRILLQNMLYLMKGGKQKKKKIWATRNRRFNQKRGRGNLSDYGEDGPHDDYSAQSTEDLVRNLRLWTVEGPHSKPSLPAE